MKKLLSFDVWGDYAHFRKFYTTTSPLSFPFPPRTALTGLIGAIIGLDKTKYIKYFYKKDADIGVSLINPLKRVRISENYRDTDKSMLPNKGITQIRLELIKDPKYRVFFTHIDTELYEKLKNHLNSHKSVYTVCLGISELLCDFCFNGEFGFENKTGSDNTEINSIVPKENIIEFNFENNREYLINTVPNEMDGTRTVLEYKEVVFEKNARPVSGTFNNYIKIENGEKIIFL